MNNFDSGFSSLEIGWIMARMSRSIIYPDSWIGYLRHQEYSKRHPFICMEGPNLLTMEVSADGTGDILFGDLVHHLLRSRDAKWEA